MINLVEPFYDPTLESLGKLAEYKSMVLLLLTGVIGIERETACYFDDGDDDD